MWSIWNAEISEVNKKIFDVLNSEYKWSETLRTNALRGGIEAEKQIKILIQFLLYLMPPLEMMNGL
jgi:hypothetical protein